MCNKQQIVALLRVKTGCEFAVQQMMKTLDVPSYCPKYLLNLPRSGMTAKPLFPAYVFVWVVDQWRMLLRCKHVYDFLRCGRGIAAVRPDVVAELRKREGPTGYIRINGKFFIGQYVTLRQAGSNLAAVYDGMTNDHKARVLLTMLGKEVSVTCHETELLAAS